MAYIIIDGYNLVGIAHDNLEQVRNDLITALQKYSEIRQHEITLVFDGWKNGGQHETKVRSRKLTVLYSRLGEKADTTIKKMISLPDREWIVVSSDREIADYADRKNHASLSSEEFEEKLWSALKYGIDGPSHADRSINESDDDTGFSRRTKGNPRQLSKKQKRKLQALRKL